MRCRSGTDWLPSSLAKAQRPNFEQSAHRSGFLTFSVTRILEQDVSWRQMGNAYAPAIEIHLYTVVYDQVSGAQWIDLFRVAAERSEGVSHGREIHHGGHAREILQQDAGGFEGNFHALALRLLPVQDILHVILLDLKLVAVSNCCLSQDPDRERQAGCYILYKKRNATVSTF